MQTIFEQKNALDCRILHMQSPKFSRVDTPRPAQKCSWCLDPDINFCLASQRTCCFCYTKWQVYSRCCNFWVGDKHRSECDLQWPIGIPW